MGRYEYMDCGFSFIFIYFAFYLTLGSVYHIICSLLVLAQMGNDPNSWL